MRLSHIFLGALVLQLIVACGSGGGGGSSSSTSSDSAAEPPPAEEYAPGAGRELWRESAQPLLHEECGSCHAGARFAFASLEGEGIQSGVADLTAVQTEANRQRFLEMVSLDNPAKSRLVAKIIPADHADSLHHGPGPLTTVGSPLYEALLDWIKAEKSNTCPDCGASAAVSYLAYVDQPVEHWMAEREP